MGYPKIDFLYLNEKDMIEAGVLDAAGCIETMRDTMELFGKKDFLLGGPNADEHGLQMNFPQKSDIEGRACRRTVRTAALWQCRHI